MGEWFDAHPDIEQACWVAWRCGKLLEYWHGRGLDDIVGAVDGAPLLFYLLRRPLFREVVNVANL